MRKAYLDNIRWSAVMLVLIYHVFYIFNGGGVPGGIPGAKNIPLCDALGAVIYPWSMPLLFIVAGMSARYALKKRTNREFIKERAVKLLIPSTLGLFAVHWITGYIYIKMGGALQDIPLALIYPVSAMSGTGHLWFIQMLFLFSCLLVLLRRTDRRDKVWTICGKIKPPMIPLLFIPVFGAAQVLNMPVFTVYRFGIYFMSFLIGYYVFSHENVREMIEKIRIPTLCLAAVGAVLYAFRYGGVNYASSDCLRSVTTNLYLWVVILAVIGCGGKYLNRETAFTRYMTKSSFGIYVLHYPILIVTGYILRYHFNLPAIWNYIIAFAAEVIITFALYELIRRLPVIRFIVLGKKGETQ